METARAEHGGLATSWDKRHKKEEERNTPVLAQICRLATVIVISALNPAHSHNTKSVIASAAVGICSASWRDAMTMKWRIGIQSVLRAGEATINQWERNRRRSSFRSRDSERIHVAPASPDLPPHGPTLSKSNPQQRASNSAFFRSVAE